MLQFHDQILCVLVRDAALETGHVGEGAAKLLEAADLKAAAHFGTDGLEQGRGTHPLSSGLVGADGRTEEVAEELFGGSALLELAVVVDDLLRLHLVEPRWLAAVEGIEGLGVELAVVGPAADVDGAGQLHAEEAARAGGVAQHVGEVGGGNERAEARHHLDVLAVGTLGLHHGQR